MNWQPNPADPEIFHITHVSNLPGILAANCLYSDSQRLKRSLTTINIGYQHIKTRRLSRKVPAAAGGAVGDYVPFNFCPRSVMLYVVSKGHDDYQGGQDDVVHLVSRVSTAIKTGQPWAFTERHAELAYALFFDRLCDLPRVDWSVMPLMWWNTGPDTREKRQAEFLVFDRFPWSAVEGISVRSQAAAAAVQRALAGSTHRPPVRVEPDWYY